MNKNLEILSELVNPVQLGKECCRTAKAIQTEYEHLLHATQNNLIDTRQTSREYTLLFDDKILTFKNHKYSWKHLEFLYGRENIQIFCQSAEYLMYVSLAESCTGKSSQEIFEVIEIVFNQEEKEGNDCE